MANKFAAIEHEKSATPGSRSYDKRTSNLGAVSLDKHNHCKVVPAKVDMVAKAIEQKDNTWFVQAKVASDLVIQIGKKSSFHIHILPMVSKSAYLNRIIFEQKDLGARSTCLNIQLDSFPGGAEIFELIIKFCYGWKIDLTVNNAALLYCASNFLEMSDNLVHSNLISRSESYLSFVIFSSWKDTFQVLKTCEQISSWARDLQIQKRCSEAIAWKVCMDPNVVSLESKQCFSNFLVEYDLEYSFGKREEENWWFEDVSALRIDHFIEVVASIKSKGIKAEILGSCIAYWAAKWLSGISFGVRIPTQKSINHQVRRVIVESLIRVLPVERNSVSCNFLLHLLKLGLMMKVEDGLCAKLEKRIASILENCQPLDLLVKNYGESDSLYDINIIARIVETYVSLSSSNHTSKIFIVGRLVDGCLALVARDENLPADAFQILAESLPRDARYSHDNLYRAIDRYLKAHPNSTEEERKEVCRAMEYYKLSQEAREHVMRNDRLPVNITTQFVLLQQVNMEKSMVDVAGSSYRRTKGQMIINLKSDSRRGCMKVQKEMMMMKQEVESIKGQLNKLQSCRVELKRLAKRV